MKVMTIRLSDVAKCPKGSLAPVHYRSDGSCKCSEREAADAALANALEALRAAKERVATARRWKMST